TIRDRSPSDGALRYRAKSRGRVFPDGARYGVANPLGGVHAHRSEADHPWRADNSGGAAMTIEAILKQKGTDVATIVPEASIRRAADWLHAKNIGALVVTSGKTLLGLISEREIVHAFSRYGEAAASMPVKDIMQYGMITVSPEESVNRVMKLMTHHRVRHM